MNQFFFSGGNLSNSPRPTSKPVDRSKFRPTMRVVRKADGLEATINVEKFHEALHEVAFPKEDDRMLTVTTPQGTSTVEMTHSYLERLDERSLRSLSIVKYVKGGNCMDRRELTRGILELLGHTEDIVKTMTVEDKEKILMQEWEARVEAEKAARAATAEEAKKVAVEAAKQALSKKKPEAPKAPKKSPAPAPNKTED